MKLKATAETEAPAVTETCGCGVVRPWHTTSDEAPMDTQISARWVWSGGGDDERPEKKVRVGGTYVGVPYNTTENIVVGEEEVEDVHMDPR